MWMKCPHTSWSHRLDLPEARPVIQFLHQSSVYGGYFAGFLGHSVGMEQMSHKRQPGLRGRVNKGIKYLSPFNIDHDKTNVCINLNAHITLQSVSYKILPADSLVSPWLYQDIGG